MKIRLTAAALCLLALPVLAQDKPAAPAPAMDPAMQAAMEKAMMLGEPHKHLARLAGDWTYTNKMWMDPSQPPVDSAGTMHGEAILGGRYVQTTWKGNMMGAQFEGRATEAYDNLAKKYVNTWMDNMGTGIIYSTGTCDDKGMKCSYKGDMIDPMSGQPSYMRSEVTWTDANTFKNEMYGPGPDGKEFKWMEMVIKRK
jgi:hypothetical protein